MIMPQNAQKVNKRFWLQKMILSCKMELREGKLF